MSDSGRIIGQERERRYIDPQTGEEIVYDNQPKPTAEQPASGKDLPDGPGVWVRDGEWWMVSSVTPVASRLLLDVGLSISTLKSIGGLPRGNWLPAVPQEAIAPSGEVERLRAEIRKWIDSGCTPPPSPQELAWYACTSCNARCVKLWREPHGGKVLKCAACLSPDKPVDERGQQPTEHGQTTDQVNDWLPAVPIGDTFYGYSSVPPQCVGWWKGLPTYDAIAQERHQAELAEMLKVKNRAANIAELTKRAETAEASVKELGVQVGNLTGELEWQKKQTEYIRDLANKQRGEIESLNYMADAVERLRDIGRVIGCDHVDGEDGRRQLVNCVEQVFAELTQQLADAHKRLAKAREALARLGKWTCCLSPFAQSILAEAQAALAEGEQA